ncbi:MAG: hypothetical protein ACI9EW_001952 [Cellvibrionaceae bacterium]|jgi:hypothetical protein
MEQEQLTLLMTWAMVITAAAGSGWYIWVEYQIKGNLESVGWSIVAVVWFVVLRRLWHQWRR